MNEPAVARPSASVILVRDGPLGVETFMVRRHARSRVAPHAYVFPGGTVRPDDAPDIEAEPLRRALTERSDASLPFAEAGALYMAAIRELFEEAGVLLARTADGLIQIDTQDTQRQERLASARLKLQAAQVSMRAVLTEFDARAAFDLLVPFSHWVTPTPVPTRFDTRFFMAAMPPAQEALHCTIETTAGVWLRPRQVLDDGYAVVYATEQHVRRLLPLPNAAAALDFARHKAIRRVQPEIERVGDDVRIRLEPALIDAW